MNLRINGEEHDVPADLSLRDLIEWLKLTDGPVAIEQNGQIVPRAKHPVTKIVEGDVLEIVHFVGGG